MEPQGIEIPQPRYLIIQEDFSIEVRLEVFHLRLHLLFHHCVEGNAQLLQLGFQS